MDLGFYLEQFSLWWSVVVCGDCGGLWWLWWSVGLWSSSSSSSSTVTESLRFEQTFVSVLGCSVKPQTPPCGVKWNCCVGQLSRPVPGWVPVHRRWLHHQRTLSSVAAQCGTDWPAGTVRSQSGGTIGSWLLFIFTSPENIYLSHIFK